MKRILVVDDDAVVRAGTVRLLQGAGYEVLEAHTGERGIEMARSFLPDLVLMDVNLPGIDGLEAARRIKADPALINAYVVNLSARRTSLDDEIDGLDAGADGYITRPVANRKLLSQVNAYLRQQQMALALRRSEAQVQRLVQQSLDGMLVVAPGSCEILFANPAAAALFGRDVETLRGQVFSDAVLGADPVEVQIQRPDGVSVSAEIRAAPVDWAGQPAMLVSLHDVSALRRATRDLAQSEQRYRSLCDQNPDAVYEMNPKGRILRGNRVFEALSGYSLDELLPHGLMPVVADEHLAVTQANFQRALQGEAVHYESVGISKSGRRVEVAVTNLPILVDGKVVGVYGIAKDITAIKQVARSLRDSEAQLAAIFAHAATGIAVITPDGRFLQTNVAFCQMLGYSHDELLALDVMRLSHPDDRLETRARMDAALTQDLGSYAWYRRFQHHNGSTVWVSASISVVRNEAGAHVQTICIFEDITGRRESEEALRRSKGLLDIAGRMSRLGGWFYDVVKRKLQWSDMVAEIHDEPAGFTPPLEQGIAYYVPEHLDAIRTAFGHCASDGHPFDLELQIITARGRRRWVRAMAEAVRDAEGHIVLVQGAFQQIDDRKATENALRELAVRLTTTLESITDAFFTLDRDLELHLCEHPGRGGDETRTGVAAGPQSLARVSRGAGHAIPEPL